MATVLLALHIMVAAALVGVVLLQKAEAGGLVSGGGGGGGGFLTGRGTANLLTRTTAVLAATFFATSIALSILAQHGGTSSVFDGSKPAPPSTSGSATPGTASGDTPAPVTPAPALPGGRGGVLDQLQKGGNDKLPPLPNTR